MPDCVQPGFVFPCLSACFVLLLYTSVREAEDVGQCISQKLFFQMKHICVIC